MTSHSFSLAVVLTTLVFLGGCATDRLGEEASCPLFNDALSEYRYFQDQATGIAISREGRMFVNFPRWDKDPLYSMAEIMPDGKPVPFPDMSWNRWGKDEAGHPEDHFVCVQSVTVDGAGYLWILDPASPAFKGVVPGGAKLVRVNLATNTVERVIVFGEATAPADSYLNDVRIDPSGGYAYITDSGAGAIVVVDLASGKSRRLLGGHPSTKAEPGYVPVIDNRELRDANGLAPQINADGIAIDPEGKYLYYHALTARALYRIGTAYLKDEGLSGAELAGRVERLKVTGAVDGMQMDGRGDLFLTALEDNAIKRYRPADNYLETVVSDFRIHWPDSIDIGRDGYLYFTDSQINRSPRFNKGKDRRTPPYKLFRILLIPH
ncbi:MAG TPA: L-dopachrome tautomerase-related protein [Geobacteraceae bacterium]